MTIWEHIFFIHLFLKLYVLYNCIHFIQKDYFSVFLRYFFQSVFVNSIFCLVSSLLRKTFFFQSYLSQFSIVLLRFWLCIFTFYSLVFFSRCFSKFPNLCFSFLLSFFFSFYLFWLFCILPVWFSSNSFIKYFFHLFI